MKTYRIETHLDSTKHVTADFIRVGPSGVTELVRRLNVGLFKEHPTVTQLIDEVVFVCGPENLGTIEIEIDPDTAPTWTSDHYNKVLREAAEAVPQSSEGWLDAHESPPIHDKPVLVIDEDGIAHVASRRKG